MHPKAVLFDAGSTLWHWEYAPDIQPLQRAPHDPALIILQALRDAGADVNDQHVLQCYDQLQLTYAPKWIALGTNGRGSTDAEVAAHFERHSAEFLQLLGLPDPDGRLLAAIRRAFLQWRPSLFPEVSDVLATLRARGVALAIVSNGWQQEADAQRLGIAHFFDAIVGSVYVGCCKPQAEIFALALRELDRSPDEAIHVGDSYDDDVIGARHAGIEPVLLDRDGTANHADVRTVRSLKELPTLVL